MAQESSRIDEIVRVYAEALLDAAGQANRLSEVAADVQGLGAVLLRVPQFVALLRAATVSSAEKHAVLERAFAGDLDALTRQALAAMARRDRLDFLPEFVRVFQEVQWQRAHCVAVEVVVPSPLNDGQRQDIVRRAAAVCGRQVELTETVNPNLLGGAQWRVGDRFCDGSLRGKLNALRRHLRQNAYSGLRPN